MADQQVNKYVGGVFDGMTFAGPEFPDTYAYISNYSGGTDVYERAATPDGSGVYVWTKTDDKPAGYVGERGDS